MARKRSRVNWNRVLSNVREAREHLQELEKELTDADRSAAAKRASLEVLLGHVYQHLNMAWRIRRWPMTRIDKMTDREYRQLSRFPTDLWIPGMDKPGTKLEPGA